MNNYPNTPLFKRIVTWLISPKLTVFCLAFLMILTFWGTVYQVEHGLYAAQQKFYNSYVFFFGGFIPFPGTQLVLAVLLVNLIGYLTKMLLFDRLKPGVVLTHLGILMLLVGGAITHNFAEESQLTLFESEGANVSASYHDWEIAVWKQKGDEREVWAADAGNLKPGDVLKFADVDINIEVQSYYQNAKAFQSPENNDVQSSRGITSLEPEKSANEPAENIAGGIFSVRAGQEPPAQILLYGEDQSPRLFKSGGDDVIIALRKRRYPLPVTVTLLDFQREMHPGTDMARRFSSKVAVDSDGVGRTMTISMNKPLRHHGYTLYQASYSELPNGQQSSTFAVARNYGRMIPYVATSIVVLGMIVHFVSMLISRVRNREAAA